MSNFWLIGTGSLKCGRLASFFQGFQNFFTFYNIKISNIKIAEVLMRSILAFTELPTYSKKK